MKIEKRTLKKAHDTKITKNLSYLTKKLEEVNESFEKLGEVIKESNSASANTQEIVNVETDNIQTSISSLPNNNKLSNNMMETLGVSMNSRESFKLIPDDSVRASVLGIHLYTLGGDRSKEMLIIMIYLKKFIKLYLLLHTLVRK